ncbi:type I restriction enzyme HsdR N-terminal domain-containing protein [Membranihabitans maritimus]|uniref:type I restriction enzyme HsdR N-terminal domain-containing protein n=1 Tax=Membranihabitans maritimus TaxID=2904244 RepID=UPI001F484A2E|nr:type I restriction enzyme HsdR N-terminal domain-containing protein [Membranihabitans maritimus]
MNIDLHSYLKVLKFKNGKVFDRIRRKWLQIQPEELVRQCMIHYIVNEKKAIPTRIAIEKTIKVFGQKRRFDIVYYNANLTPHILFECKAPGVNLTEQTFEQAIWYNYQVSAPFLILSNGKQNVGYRVDVVNKTYKKINSFPDL